jgi:EmrB/QacA subfamily drug resistance transporter
MPVAGEPTGRRVLIPIGLVAFITSLDATVVTNAAPSIQNDLGLSRSALEWVATSYILAFASLLLVGGRLTDMVGRRRVLVVGMWGFMLASAVVAVADGGFLMLIGRTGQGAAAAMIVPAVLSILASDLESKDRHLGAAIYTMSIAGSLALGPVVGGAISQYLNWSYIFWMNVPVVLIVLAATAWAVPNSRPRTPIQGFSRSELAVRLDVPGLVLSSVSMATVTFALVEGPNEHFPKAALLLVVLLAVAALVATVMVERRAAFPLVDVDLLTHKVVAGGTIVQVLWGLGINGVFFFTSLFFQNVMHLSPSKSGVMFVPLAVTLILAVPLSVKLATKIGPHGTVAIGMLAVALGLAACTFVGEGDGMLEMLPGLLLIGFGSALTTPMTSATLEAVPSSRAGVVSAVISVSREISGVLGIALTGLVVTFRERALKGDGATAAESFTSGYHWGQWLGAVAALIGAWVAWKTLMPGQAKLRDLDMDLDMETDGDGPQSPADGFGRYEPARPPLAAPVAPRFGTLDNPITGPIPMSPLIWPEPPRGRGRHRAPDPVAPDPTAPRTAPIQVRAQAPLPPAAPIPHGVDNLADLVVDLRDGAGGTRLEDWEVLPGNGKHRA